MVGGAGTSGRSATRARGFSSNASSADSYRYTMSPRVGGHCPFRVLITGNCGHRRLVAAASGLTSGPAGDGAASGPVGRMPPVTGDHYFTAEPSAAGPSRARSSSTSPGATTRCLRRRGLLRRPARPRHRRPAAQGRPADRRHRWPLLDLGCGFGPISLRAGRPRADGHRLGGRRQRAGPRADRGERRPDRRRRPGHAVAPDEVPADVTFTQIWSNPPIHIGKDELHGLLRRWLPRLAPDGVGLAGGGPAPRRRLAARAGCVDEGCAVTRHASQKGYRVLRVTR